MMKKTVFVGLALLVAGIVGAVVLGPSHVANLARTQQDRLQDQTSQWVDPEVELASAAREAERQLPKQVASLKLAIQEADEELAAQVGALQELEQATALIDKDLRLLAPVLLEGKDEACELHGQKYAPEQAKDLAERLLVKRDQYADLVVARTSMIAKLRKQRCKLDEHLSKAEAALRDFAANARQVRAKVELVKANEKVEGLQNSLGNNEMFTASTSSLQRLERRLDAQLQEAEERATLREGLAGDSYVETARDREMMEELQAYWTTQGNKEEAGE